jgi:hypothetical protein
MNILLKIVRAILNLPTHLFINNPNECQHRGPSRMHAEKENRVHAYLHANLMHISPTSSLIHGLRHANKKKQKTLHHMAQLRGDPNKKKSLQAYKLTASPWTSKKSL